MSNEVIVTIPLDTPLALKRALERMLEEIKALKERIEELENKG